jgi:hypothetical protein
MKLLFNAMLIKQLTLSILHAEKSGANILFWFLVIKVLTQSQNNPILLRCGVSAEKSE